MSRILVVNPGSTSTKIGIFEVDTKNKTMTDLVQKYEENITHDPVKMKQFGQNIFQQLHFRTDCILDFLKKNGVTQIDCIVGRGGLCKPLSAGSYSINDQMKDDLANNRYGAHASNLGALIADDLGKRMSSPAFVTDPVCVDEMSSLARYTGLSEIKRGSMCHALNVRATARRFCADRSLDFTKTNLVVAHIGGGVTIAAICNGKLVDVSNALDGGPFTPQRTGALPTTKLVKLAFSGKYKTAEEMNYKLTRESGLLALLGTDNGKEIVAKIESGDKKAEEVFMSMAYHTAKEIGAMSTVSKGDVHAILITGGLARSPLVDWIKERISWIADVYFYPGEMELLALAEAGARFLCEAEILQEY